MCWRDESSWERLGQFDRVGVSQPVCGWRCSWENYSYLVRAIPLDSWWESNLRRRRPSAGEPTLGKGCVDKPAGELRRARGGLSFLRDQEGERNLVCPGSQAPGALVELRGVVAQTLSSEATRVAQPSLPEV